VEETLGEQFKNTRIPAAITHMMKKPEQKRYKKVAKKYGLPLIGDKQNEEKIENILHVMAENDLLKFHPPSRWSVL
jgi:hypothetical protein